MERNSPFPDANAAERRRLYIERIAEQAPALTPERYSYLSSLFRKTGGV